MAAIKLPPRQRMINMMYLVLTAMLAMNVSKEVLDAFAVLDADLVRSEQAHEQRSRVEYAAFDDAAKKFPDRFMALSRSAHHVEAVADSLVRHIEHIKTRVIGEAEGLTEHELVGKAADGRDTLLALARVEAKDDRDVLTHMLVGSEPAAPKEGEGSASDLKERIARFRDELKELCAARGPEMASALDLLFDLQGREDASGTMNNWESINFYEVPLAAGIAHLSKLQADIRSAENDVIRWLYRSATMDARVMSDVAAAVIPRSSVVMLGDTFSADVFLAAYDAKNRARITLNEGGELPMGADGKGKLRVRADQVGERSLSGVIRVQGPKGMEEHPYSVTYQVMAPVLVASPTKMNVLYRGVDNPLAFSVPGVTPENVRPMIDNGSVQRGKDGWFVKVNKLGTSRLSASVIIPDGSARTIGPVEFRVKDLPPPMASVNGITAADAKASLTRLKFAPGIRADRSKECDFDEPYSVLGYTVVANVRGNVVEHTVTGGAFDKRTKDILEALRPGDRVWFEGIKAQLTSKAGPVFGLANISVKTTN
jgi:gliding motility-associated protein GldM